MASATSLASTEHPVSVERLSLAPPAAVARTRERRILDAAAILARVDEETERALRYDREVSVLVLSLGRGHRVDTAALVRVAKKSLRSVDIVGWGAADEAIVLLPETGANASTPARRLLDAIGSLAPDACVGIGACPKDGCSADALLAAARDAARGAPPAAVAAAVPTATTILLGDRVVVAADARTRRVFDLVQRLGASDIPVLIGGETGVGKEIVAALLHDSSPRRTGPFVAVNCAAIAESLLDSELFGHERGAFSGAFATKIGLFESADGGTLFLDEVGECSPQTQAKLLRALETKRITRVGAVAERAVDVRVVSATNRDLAAEVTAGRFRQDLFYRISAASIHMPALRERPRDTEVLAKRFLDDACAKLGRAPHQISGDALDKLATHAWPGNVRELRNLMELLAATVLDDVIDVHHVPLALTAPMATPTEADEPLMPLYDEIAALERTRIAQALRASKGVRVVAAARLGIPLRTLVTKIRVYALGKVVTREGR